MRGATKRAPTRCRATARASCVQLPDAFLRRACGKRRHDAAGARAIRRRHGVPAARSRRRAWRANRRSSARSHGEGQVLLGWRDVPTDNAGLSERTKDVEPVIRQVFIARGANAHRPGRARAQALHHQQASRARDPGAEAQARQGVLRAVDVDAHDRLQGHAARASGRRVLPRSDAIRTMVSALAMVHQRFSTNTFPTWDLAHPFRLRLPQRRDQHAARQRQLDSRAAAGDRAARFSAMTSTRSGR